MKNTVKFIASVALLAGFVSCEKYAEYSWVPFATVDKTSVKVNEDGATASIDVHAYNLTGAATVSYDIVETSAKLGENFTTTGNGTLNFSETVDTQTLTFNIIDNPGVYTGDLKFSVVLKSATDGVTIGTLNECLFTIKDNDHPLVSLFGEYTFKSVQYSGSSYGYIKCSPTLSAYEGDPYKVWIDQLFGFQIAYGSYLSGDKGKCYANVSKDFKTISIPVPQSFNTDATAAFGSSGDDIWIYKCDGFSFDQEPGEIVFTLQEDGSYVTTDDFGLNSTVYIASSGGDWLYYYMNVFATKYASYPAVLKKN